MHSRIHRLGLALCLAMTAPLALAADDISKVNGSIETTAGQAYGDLETVNGSIRIGEGVQARDASTVNGGITVAGRAQLDSLETVNGAIRLDGDVRVSGGIDTVNGSIFVDRGGVVGGNIETVNGAIGLVGTAVEGRIETVNGDVTVGADSRVARGIRVEKPKGNFGLNFGRHKIPRVVVGPNAVVEGPLVFEREVKLYVHASARVGSVSGATAVRYDGASPPKD